MATNRTFQAMLNQYLPNSLLKEELLKRDYILQNCQKDNNYKGGKLIVPFKGASASSVRMGKLTASSDISQDEYVRGSIDGYVESWASMIFDHSDLVDHSGKINEDSFLKILPETVDDFLDNFKMTVSIQLGTGPHFAKATVDGTAGGILAVDRIERFTIGQKVTLKGDATAAADFYVLSIDINKNLVTLSDTRGGATASVAAYTVADNAKVFTDDADEVSFQSMRDAYLSAENGGSATLHNVTKTSYPFLQATNINGASWTKANILEKLFQGYNTVRKKARGRASKILVDYTVGAAIMAAVENGGGTNGYRGNFSVSQKSRKASLYGWDEIVLNTVKGELTIVMIQEWDSDIVVYHDPKSCTFRTNGYFMKRKNPEGHEFYEIRTENGYQYILDMALYGQMEHTRPQNNGIVYGIDAANFA